MSNLEQNLREYLDTRDWVCSKAIERHGKAGAHEAVTEQRTIADIRAIMDGQPLLPRGAE